MPFYDFKCNECGKIVEEFFCLSRSEEEREDSDIGGGGIYNINPMMREELAMCMW